MNLSQFRANDLFCVFHLELVVYCMRHFNYGVVSTIAFRHEASCLIYLYDCQYHFFFLFFVFFVHVVRQNPSKGFLNIMKTDGPNAELFFCIDKFKFISQFVRKPLVYSLLIRVPRRSCSLVKLHADFLLPSPPLTQPRTAKRARRVDGRLKHSTLRRR